MLGDLQEAHQRIFANCFQVMIQASNPLLFEHYQDFLMVIPETPVDQDCQMNGSAAHFVAGNYAD